MVRNKISKDNYWLVDTKKMALEALSNIAEDLIIAIWEEAIQSPDSKDFVLDRDFYSGLSKDRYNVKEILLSNHRIIACLDCNLGCDSRSATSISEFMVEHYCEELTDDVIEQYWVEYKEWVDKLGLLDEE